MDIKLPNLGEGADSGTVVTILVKAGDTIKVGQAVIELENEKAIAPIPATAAGVVAQIYVKEGQKLSVGQRILAVGESAGAAPKPASEPAAPAPKSKAAPKAASRPAPVAPAPEPEPEEGTEPTDTVAAVSIEPVQRTGPPPASPSIRKMARELGIDLSRVHGSEHGGRIVLEDLKAYIARLQAIAFAPKPAPTAAVRSEPVKPVAESIDFSQFGPVTKKPMSSLRGIISRRMTESWTTIPHVTQFDEADITGLTELRKKYSAAYEAKGARLTLTPFTLKAVVAALKQSPAFNSSLDEATHEIVFKDYYHIGLAVDTDSGLIVPVIRDVDKKSILQISKELQDIAERTRSRKISGDELKGGTFTISNQGPIGGAQFTPIINKPEAAILGLGRSVMKPVVRKDKIEARMMMPMGLSYDHRLIDGGNAARFIVQLVQAIEQFSEDEVKRGLE
jgi:pyruvate dehydrogenase E2 component (dihydrolipoamide acetyltransferase)